MVADYLLQAMLACEVDGLMVQNRRGLLLNSQSRPSLVSASHHQKLVPEESHGQGVTCNVWHQNKVETLGKDYAGDAALTIRG